ncbi:MAG TPA: extracellular solute-binding protein [Anaerolineales bacterium]|nr:extracellular solute-binding protein [Anaerolineales bacterium]
MTHKSIRLTLSLLTLGGLLLAACGGGATPTQAPPPTQPPAEQPTQPPAAGEKVKVVIFVGMGTGTDPDQIDAQTQLAEKFNSAHDQIEIEFLIVPHEEYATRYLAMLSGGNAPQLVGPNGVQSVAEFFDTWEDITPYIQAENYDLSDFYGPAVTLNEYPDKNTGLPLGLYPSFIFYNKDLFDAAGLDYPTHDFDDTSWTMDKLREDAMKLTLDKNGKNAAEADFDPENIVQFGYDDSWDGMRGTLTMWDAPTIGRPVSDDYKTALVNSPEWLYGLQWLSDGIWEDHFVGSLAVQQARDAVGVDPFGPGTTAMFYSHTWFMAEGLKELSFEADIAPLPFNQKGHRIARIDADNFTIPKDAQHKQEAWEVMKWLASPEIIVEVCQIYGCIPARKSVQEQYLETLKQDYPGIDYDVIFRSIDYLDDPNNEAFVPEWSKIDEALNNSLSLVYTGDEKDAKKVLDGANAEVQKVLDEYWAAHP